MFGYRRILPFLILITAISAQAESNSDSICQDMNAYACGANRTWQDGTNQHAILDADQVTDVLKKAVTASSIDVASEADNYLKTGGADEDFEFHVFAAAGLDKKPAYKTCFDEEGKRSDFTPKCREAVSTALSDILKSELTVDFLPASFAGGDLARIDVVRNTPEFSKMLSRLADKVERAAVTAGQREKVNSQFELVKATYHDLISRLQISDAAKKAMKTRVDKMKLNSETCANTEYRLQSNAFYDLKKNEMRICPLLIVTNDSTFAIMRTMAHEMGHSLDRCLIQPKQTIRSAKASAFSAGLVQKLDDGHPLGALNSCLRKADSINAKMCRVEALKCEFTDSTAKTACGYFQKMKTNFDSCGGSDSRDTEDQSRESTADWFAAETLAQAIPKLYPNLTAEQWRAGLANTLADRCSQSGEDEAARKASLDQRVLPCDSHPETKDRYNAILAAQPVLRAKMGCKTPSNKKYCDGGLERSSENSNAPSLPVKNRSTGISR